MSPALGLGLTAGVPLVFAQAILNTASGCICCKKKPYFSDSQSSHALTTDNTSRSYIVELLNGPLSKFFEEFGLSMEKLGRMGVKTRSTGEIRKNYAPVNS